MKDKTIELLAHAVSSPVLASCMTSISLNDIY